MDFTDTNNRRYGLIHSSIDTELNKLDYHAALRQ